MLSINVFDIIRCKNVKLITFIIPYNLYSKGFGYFKDTWQVEYKFIKTFNHLFLDHQQQNLFYMNNKVHIALKSQ